MCSHCMLYRSLDLKSKSRLMHSIGDTTKIFYTCIAPSAHGFPVTCGGNSISTTVSGSVATMAN